MKITDATQSNVQELAAFLELTFRDTYAKDNTPENIEKHVYEKFNVETLCEEILAHPYFIIKEAEEIIAIAKLVQNSPLEGVHKKTIELERIYIHPELKGKGIGKLLINHCLNWAAEAGFEILWLGVWEHNPNAIAFYLKMEFQQFGTHVFVLGEDAQTDYVLIKELLVHHK